LPFVRQVKAWGITDAFYVVRHESILSLLISLYFRHLTKGDEIGSAKMLACFWGLAYKNI